MKTQKNPGRTFILICMTTLLALVMTLGMGALPSWAGKSLGHDGVALASSVEAQQALGAYAEGSKTKVAAATGQSPAPAQLKTSTSLVPALDDTKVLLGTQIVLLSYAALALVWVAHHRKSARRE